MHNDVRPVLRGLARSPLTAVLAAAALCVGIAVTVAIFTVARGVLLRGLPYPEGDRLVLIWRGSADDALARGAVSPPDFVDVRAQATSFEVIAAVNSFSTTYVPDAGDVEQVQLGVVAGEFFAALGVAPLLGRSLTADDDRPLNTRDSTAVGVIVLDYAFWLRVFGRDENVIGRSLDFGGNRMLVLGVMPPSFRLHMPAGAGLSTDVVGWTPLGIDYATAPRDGAYLKMLARLAPGVSLSRAQAELDGVASRLRAAVPEHAESELQLRAAALEHEVTAHIRPILILLSASGILLLLVACANAATLLLVRFMARRPEAAVRSALGAARRDVLRPLLLESGFIAFAGTAAGLLLASPAVGLLLRLEPGIVPRTSPLHVDAPVVLVALGLALVLAVACGLAPALLVTRGELAATLRSQRVLTTPGAQRLRRGMIVLQAAASFALLYSSASLIGTLVRLQRTDLGFDQAGVMTARVTLPFTRYPGPDRWVGFFAELTQRLESAPGVHAVAFASDLPMAGDLTLEPYAPVERAATTEWGVSTALYRIVTPGWFTAARVPIRAGRDFTRADRTGASDVLIVDETLAHALSGGAAGGVVGRRMVVTVHEFREGYRVTRRTAEIVGVAGTVAHEHPDARAPGTIYMPHGQYPLWTMVATVRGRGATAPGIGVVRAALDGLDRQLPLSSVRPLTAVVDATLAQTRFVLALIGILSVAVIVLTAAGLFGIVAETVRQRRRELGLRLAIGATPGGLARRMLRSGVELAALGIVPGALLAPGAGRLIERGVAGTGGFMPTSFAAAAITLLCVAAAACILPAWRAGRVDPMTTLREE